MTTPQSGPLHGADTAGRVAVHPAGTVVVSHHPVTSKAEQELRRRLEAAGLRLHPGRSALQCGWDDVSGNRPVITPDFLIRDAPVCIEFDPAHTHGGHEDTDRRRNRLLADIGWTVVRLRTGGLGALGPFDVTTDTASFTNASVDALVDAVDDAVAGHPGRIRHVARAPKRERTTSRLGAITAHKHLENAFWASWTLDSGAVARLVVMAGGHYLGGTGSGWGTPAFIMRLGLDRVPRDRWRGALGELLTPLHDDVLLPATWFPWGDDLFTGTLADTATVDRRFNLGAEAHIGRFELPTVTSWDATTISAGGATLTLHAGAVDAGWRIADLRNHGGRSGIHQRYLLMRDGQRRGLWAEPAPPGPAGGFTATHASSEPSATLGE